MGSPQNRDRSGGDNDYGGYAEPWIDGPHGNIEDQLGRTPVLNGFRLAAGTARADADEWTRRVLACVNACAGIPTVALEAFGVGGVTVAAKRAEAQEEALRAVAKIFRRYCDRVGVGEEWAKSVEAKVRDALTGGSRG